ncbi:MAG TPA: hypothetical protein VK001_03670, partial [Geminicoccaceae bacterium]|nr:hypothetical protein [Geminicoccaceae bacterium]
SMAIPVSAIAFSVYAFGSLATNIDLDRWQQPATLVLIALALLAVAAVLAASICLIRVEWLMLFHEPPDLDELVDAEARIRAALGHEASREEAVERHYIGMLTGAYDIAYRRQFVGNEASAKYRAWAVRYVVLALVLLFLAYMVLPFHTAAGS